MPGDDVSLRQAAEILGVHYMTAYRQVRTGRLAARQVDGEWRVRRADLADGAGDGAPSRTRRPSDRRLAERLLAGDERGAWSLLEDAIVGGLDPVDAHLRLLAPAMRTIGDAWAAGDVDVGEEHRATAVAHRLVGRLGPRFARPGRKRGVVVLAGAPGDPHALPIAIAADVLRAAGYAVVDLGADVPPESVAAAVAAEDRLVAVGLSTGTIGGDRDLQRSIRASRRAAPDVPVLVGGPAMDADRAAVLGADGYAADAAGLVELLGAPLGPP